MRWSSILLPFYLLGAGVLAAKSDPANTFNDFHQKQLSSTPVKLEDATYKKVTGLPRDYTVAVLLTALDSRYACQMCRDFDPEWRLLSKSWAKGDKAGDSRTLFTVLDFNDGRDTFMSVCAQSSTLVSYFIPSLVWASLTNCLPPARTANRPCPPALPTLDWRIRCCQHRPRAI